MGALLVNWRTTIGGIATALSAAGALLNSLSTGNLSDILVAIPGILSGMTLMAAKDGNVTGGTKSAATGHKITMPVSVIDAGRTNTPYR